VKAIGLGSQDAGSGRAEFREPAFEILLRFRALRRIAALGLCWRGAEEDVAGGRANSGGLRGGEEGGGQWG